MMFLLIAGLVALALFAGTLYYINGETQTFLKYGSPFFAIPESWFFWPKGRSMTLLLPILGTIVFVHPLDMPPHRPIKLFHVMMAQEWLGHAPQYNKIGYRLYFLYLFSKKWRFKLEAEAFAQAVICARQLDVKYQLDGKPASAMAYYAHHLSADYRLGHKYPYFRCLNAIQKEVLARG